MKFFKYSIFTVGLITVSICVFCSCCLFVFGAFYATLPEGSYNYEIEEGSAEKPATVEFVQYQTKTYTISYPETWTKYTIPGSEDVSLIAKVDFSGVEEGEGVDNVVNMNFISQDRTFANAALEEKLSDINLGRCYQIHLNLYASLTEYPDLTGKYQAGKIDGYSTCESTFNFTIDDELVTSRIYQFASPETYYIINVTGNATAGEELAITEYIVNNFKVK